MKYHHPTIRDLRLRILKYEVYDTKLADLLDDLSRSIHRSEVACDRASEATPEIIDAIVDDETAYIEELIGISCVALQAKIRRIRLASKNFDIEAMEIGDEFLRTGKTLIGLIWDVANYYKHRDEWSDEVWEDTEKPDRWLEQARRTRRSVQKIGIVHSSTGNLRTAYEFFGITPYSNCRQLAEKVQAWAEGVYAECARQSAEDDPSKPP